MDTGINERIAARVRQLRADHGMTLDTLAEVSGVSRSMISLIERGETSPTAVLLEKLAVSLSVTLAALFDAPVGTPDPVARRAGQPLWRDPASGYVRRNVSPSSFQSPIRIVEVVFPAGAHVAYETTARKPLTHQQIWVLSGEIEITADDDHFVLGAGDCLALVLDRPIAYRNRTRKPACYAVVIATGSGSSR